MANSEAKPFQRSPEEFEQEMRKFRESLELRELPGSPGRFIAKSPDGEQEVRLVYLSFTPAVVYQNPSENADPNSLFYVVMRRNDVNEHKTFFSYSAHEPSNREANNEVF